MKEVGKFPLRKCINDQDVKVTVQQELIYSPGHGKLQKCVRWPLLHEGQFREKTKIGHKVKREEQTAKISQCY